MAFTLTILDNANHTATVSKQIIGRSNEAGEVITVVTPSSLYNLGYDAYLHFLLPDGSSVYKGAYVCNSASFTVTIGVTDNILSLRGTLIIQFVLKSGTSFIWKSEEKKVEVTSAVNAIEPATALDYLYVEVPSSFNYGNFSSYDSTAHTLTDTGLNALNGCSSAKRTQKQVDDFLFYDGFSRDDSALSLGNADSDRAEYTVLTNAANIAWGIDTHEAYVASLDTTGIGIAYKDIGYSDCQISCRIKNAIGVSGGGIAFRIADINNFMYVSINGNDLGLYRYNAGSLSLYKGYQGAKAINDTTLTISLSGSSIKLYLDGLLIINTANDANETSTSHGLFSNGTSTNYRWSELKITPVVPLTSAVVEGFEDSLSKWFWGQEKAATLYSQTFDTTIKETGSYSLRIELRKTDADVATSKRSEITFPSTLDQPMFQEHWYGFSIYLPNGGAEDYLLDTQPEILFQMHANPDYSESASSSPLSLMTRNGNWVIDRWWHDGQFTDNATIVALGNNESTTVGSYLNDKGKWTKWMFHVKWGYAEFLNPLLEVYKNGVLVLDRNGYPNCYNDLAEPYFKLGVYKYVWKSDPNSSQISTRVVYYDNVIIY